LLVNYRPEYQHSWGGKTFYTQLRLDPLPPASAAEVLQALLGDDVRLTPLTQLLIARTEGSPFFLEESVRTLVETGLLVGEPGRPSTTRVGWDRPLSFYHAISTAWAWLTRPSPPASAPSRSPQSAGRSSCRRWHRSVE
jgi:hypothetical protein